MVIAEGQDQALDREFMEQIKHLQQQKESQLMGFGHDLEGPAPAQLLTAIQRLNSEDNLLLCFPVQGSRCSPPLHRVCPIALQWSQLPKTSPSTAFAESK